MTKFDPKDSIPVMEHFYTIQGEGFHQGRPAYFIRLAGCDVGCTWCDVKESWTVSQSQTVRIDDLTACLDNYPAGICVITGGEPAMYDLKFLTSAIRSKGWKCNLETSGTYEITGDFDWICLSPKKFRMPLDACLRLADELKVIVYNKSDLTWGETHRRGLNDECLLYFQPEWSKEKLVLPLIIDYVKLHPEWRISLQIHKYLGID